jgi:cytoskeleton protein RodZ
MFEIGTTLREARLRRNLDVPACEAETKIRAKYLRAMEEEQFDLMPSPTYVRGFLRTYADFLDLDGQLVLDEYESRFIEFDGPRDGPRGRGRGRPERSAGVRRLHTETRDPRRPPATRVRSGPPRRRRTELQLLWLAIGGVMSVALLIWLGVANDSAGQAPIAPAPSAASVPPEDADTDTGEAPVRDLTVIRLQGVGDIGSYLQIRGGGPDGRVVFDRILGPGESRRFAVERALWVNVGNADGLEVTVDGVEREVPNGDSLLARSGDRTAGG